MRSRASRILLALAVLVALESVTALLGALRENPFRVAAEAVAATGGWPEDSVRFQEGSYTALPFVFLTEARVAVTTPRGERSARIALFHVPLASFYLVRSFAGPINARGAPI